MPNYKPCFRGHERSALVERGSTIVAEVFTDREPGDQYQNAALFAAAPKLLEALNDLLDDLQLDMKTSPASAYRMVISGQRIEQARAAIAKATGV